MRIARLAIPLVAIGLCLTLVGLGLDAALHSADPDLSTDEGIFAPSNPGHNLLWAGIVMLVAGVGLGILTSDNARSLARRFTPIAALVALTIASVGLAVTEAEEGHDESTFVHEDGQEHDEDEHGQVLAAQAIDQSQPTSTASQTDGENRHDAGHEVALTLAEYDELQEQLQAARDGSVKYRDVAMALADGYVQTTSFVPGTGMHMINRSITGFDPARPEILLYEPDPDGDGWKLVGIGYRSPFKPRAPQGFAGPLDVWHNHTNRCVLTADLRVFNAEDVVQCRLMGGDFIRQSSWVLHVWLYEDSPTGIFSHQNSQVR